MKKIIFLFSFVLFVCPFYAQEQQAIWELDQPESGTKNYIARDYVKLLKGFKYTQSSSNTFKASTNSSLVLDVDYLLSQPDINRELDKSLAVGSIPGTFDVSATGAATYSIPIEVPPGTAGMQPSLGIAYSSQAGNGLLGVGWNVVGLSAITRTGSTVYNDGICGGVNLDDNDKYALDGNRLFNLHTPYGGNNVDYRTENESFSAIRSFDENNDNQPEYFKVWTKEGQVIEFGNSTDSRMTFNGKALFWYISKITDVNGNYIEYKYTTQDNELVLSNINYTGTSSSTPYNTIVFYYTKRTADQRTYYISGNMLKSNLLINRIAVKCEGNLTSEYFFNYTSNVFSRLSKVDLIKNDQKVNSTIFSYGSNNTVIASAELNVEADNWLSQASYAQRYYTVADINEDGLTDLVSVFPYKIYTTPSSWYEVTKLQVLEAEPSSNGIPSFKVGFYKDYDPSADIKNIKSINASLTFGDFTGDKTRDIIQPVFSGQYLEFKLLNHTNLSIQVATLSCSGSPVYAIQDLNGDGLDEIIYVENIKNGDVFPGKIVYTTKSGNNTAVDFNLSINKKPTYIFIIDNNSDGLNDVMVLNEDGYYIYKNTNGSISSSPVFSSPNFNSTDKAIKPGDFNGDGLTDFILNVNTYWSLAINHGNWGFSLVPITGISAYDDSDTDKDDDKDDVIVTDFNNDGKTDIIVCDATYHWEHDLFSSWKEFTDFTVYWYKSLGEGMQLVKTAVSTNENDAYSKFFQSGDFNGDGRIDIMNYGFNCYYREVTNGWKIYHSFNENYEALLIRDIVNGSNIKTTIRYKPISHANVDNDNFYTKTDNSIYPIDDIQIPFYCVNSIIVTDGSSDFTNIYNYSNATIHKQGKGFLGFSEVSKTNVELGIQSKSTFDKSITLNGNTYYLPMLKSTLTKTISGSSISGTANTYTVTEINPSNKRIFSWIKESTTTDYLTGFAARKTNYYNTQGNPDSIIIENLEGSNLIAKTVTKYTNYADRITAGGDQNTYYNGPGTISVTTTHHDDPESIYPRQTNFTYNTKGQLLTQIDDPGKSQAVTTTNEYYSDGKLLKVTVSASGLTSRYSSFEYDSRGRFVTKETNTLGYYTEKGYDEKTGNVLWESDINSNKSYYQYDSWSHLSASMSPIGVCSFSALNWYSGTGLTNALYYTTTSSQGSAPVITYYDKFDREIEVITKNNDGRNIYADMEYNAKGQVLKASAPYFEGEKSSAKWTSFTYDVYGRKTKDTFDGTHVTNYIYTNATIKTANENSGQWSSKTMDAAGNVKTAEDMGGTITYKYSANGQVKQIVSPGSTVDMTYDEYGRQISLTDPDAGTITYQYNAYGELISQTDARGNVFQTTYDQLGRLVNNTGPEGTTGYEYFTEGNGKGLLRKMTRPNGMYDSYVYDGYGRTTSETSYIESNQVYTTSNLYDSYGRVSEITYPSGFAITYVYNTLGFLDEVRQKDNNTIIWKAGVLNKFGKWDNYTLGNNLLKSDFTYNAYGLPQTIQTKKVSTNTTIQSLQYLFDNTTGNLTWRKDHMHKVNNASLNEEFYYDNLNRLTGYKINGGTQQNINYSNAQTGTITHKDLVGDYAYAGTQPHAVTELNNAGTNVPSSAQDIDYTSFNKVSFISENNAALTASIVYGPEQTRKKMVLNNNSTITTTYYDGIYEKEIKNTDTRQLHYISGADGLCAIYEIKNGTGLMYYVLTDYLGSYHVIANATGVKSEEYSFDPWGRRRNPNDWTYTNVPVPVLVTRGFTGHEHLDAFNLINMNGRVYDPFLGVFLSPDNYVQSPDFTQNFNRYAYCLNNPLIYTDPSGDIIFTLLATVFCPPLIPLAINIDIGWMTGGFQSLASGGTFWEGAWKGGINGAINGLTSYIGVPGIISNGLMQSGISIGTNGLVNTLNKDPFFENWESAAISGFANGAYSGYNLAKELHANLFTGSLTPSLEYIIENEYGLSIHSQYGIGTHGSKYYVARNSNLPIGYKTKKGFFKNEQGEILFGFSNPGTKRSENHILGSDVYISKNVIKNYFLGDKSFSLEQIKHEMFHVNDYISGNYIKQYNTFTSQGITGDALNISMQNWLEFRAYNYNYFNLKNDFFLERMEWFSNMPWDTFWGLYGY